LAKVHFVEAFRGQRKCQQSDGRYGVCGQPKAVHPDLDHPFTQAPLTCGSCGQPINIGDPYKWVAPRAHRAARGVKKVRHTSCPSWKASELTSSQHLATIYAAQEDAEVELATLSIDSLEDVEGMVERLQEIASAFADNLQEAVDSYAESADNIEDGFGHETYQSQELRENSEAIEGWMEEAGQFYAESFDGELICAECGLDEESCQGSQKDEETRHDYDEDPDVLQDWLEGQMDALTEVIYNSPL